MLRAIDLELGNESRNKMIPTDFHTFLVSFRFQSRLMLTFKAII